MSKDASSKQTRREEARLLLEKGLTVRQVANLMGTTSQAVYDHIRALERTGWARPAHIEKRTQEEGAA